MVWGEGIQVGAKKMKREKKKRGGGAKPSTKKSTMRNDARALSCNDVQRVPSFVPACVMLLTYCC